MRFNELLFQHGINFNEVPVWQRRGVGLYRQIFEKEGASPLTRERVISTRRRILHDTELPRGDAYGLWLERIVDAAQTM